MKPPPYLFKDEQHKRDCIIQSMQLSREMFSKNPPRGKTDHMNALVYLGLVYLLEQTLTRKVVKGTVQSKKEAQTLGLKLSEVGHWMKTETRLRRIADRFLANPTKTTLRLSVI